MPDQQAVTLPESNNLPAGRPLPYSLPPQEVAVGLRTDLERGLPADQVATLRSRYGLNELVEAPPVPLWRKVLRQFNELVIWLLVAASVVSGFLGDWTDALAILAIVLLNGFLGFLQEERAARALAALRQMSAPVCRVVRDGAKQELPARELVPGDRVELEAGDYVPADARLVQAVGLRVQEAALTGESGRIEKDGRAVLPPETPLGDRHNMVYQGTVIAAGHAAALVVATGTATELGRIAGLLERAEPATTPLQRRLAE